MRIIYSKSQSKTIGERKGSRYSAGPTRLRSIYRSFSPCITHVCERAPFSAEVYWDQKGFFTVQARGNPKVVRMGLVILPSVFDVFNKNCKKCRAHRWYCWRSIYRSFRFLITLVFREALICGDSFLGPKVVFSRAGTGKSRMCREWG